MKCRLEWDLSAGPVCDLMRILIPRFPIRLGHGGMAGEWAGVAASAGAGSDRTGTIPGGDCR